MDIWRLSLSELGGKVLAGEVSAEEAARSFLTRAHERQAETNAFITLDDEGALARARALDLIGGEARSSMRLFGVPIAIKDNICVAGEATTCGSKILQHFVPPYNATVTEKLVSAGAIILGKTNLDEFAMGSSTETSFFGITRNPYDLDRSPGGSSGGSTAAVAAGCAPCALGTDTGGSIRQPASFCGVVGLKPTYGRVSRYGLVAFAPSFDQIGPITRNVRDAALLLEVIAGSDPRDSTSVNLPVPEFSKLLDGDLSGLKVGVIKEHVEGELTPLVARAVQDAMLALERLGVEIVPVSLPHLNYAVAVYYILGTAETSSNLLRYDGVRYGHRASSYSDLADMYCKTRKEGFGQEVKRRIILGTFVLSTGYYEAYYIKAQKVRTLIIQDLRTAFDKVDMLMGPTSPQEAFKIGEKLADPLTMYLSDVFTIPANLAGLPAISIPYNSKENALPVGVQLIARSFDEARMLRVARALESENSQTGKE